MSFNWRTGLCLCIALFGFSHAAEQNESDKEKVPLALETFDRVWRIINDNHFDTNFSGVDWKAVREKYRPKAAASSTPKELRDTLQEMLDLLKLSHLAIIS